MLHAKKSLVGITAGLRTIIFQHQANTAYDIHLIAWNHINISPVDINDVVMAALSQRFLDQVEDEATIGFDEISSEEGIFGIYGWSTDLVTSGSTSFVGGYVIPFAKPYRVPYASVLFNMAVANASTLGVEVFFERVRISAMEQAQLVAQAGGQPRTS